MKSAPREPRLPGLTRKKESRQEEPELPWQEEDPGSDSARVFAEREKQAVAALGKAPEIQNTLRGAPDTIRLGAQTWKPPDDGATTARLKPVHPRLEDDPMTDAVTDVDRRRRGGAVVSEDLPQVAGVIRADDEPARIVSHPPGDPSPSGGIPVSVSVSPSIAAEMHEATTMPMPKIRRPESPPVPEPTPIPRAPPNPVGLEPPPGVRTMLVQTGRPSRRGGAILFFSVLSAACGVGAGYAIWGMGPAPEASAPSAAEPSLPAAVAAPEAGACKLAVRSEPPGAEVKIGDEQVGATPVDLDRDCGEVSVAISKEHYEPALERLTLEPDSIGVISETLERPIYKVAIRSVPRGADVTVAGKAFGKTPLTIELPGFEKAEIELTYRGYRPYRRTITPRRKWTRLKPRLRKR